MSEFRKRILVSALVTIFVAPVGYVAHRAIGASHLLDPLSDRFGGLLSRNATPKVEWIVAGIIAVVAYFAVLFVIWRQFRFQEKSEKLEPNWPIAEAIDYVVNDSTAILKQPRPQWIGEFGPGKGQRIIEKGVEHTDARRQMNEGIINGDIRVWGLRQLAVTHMANQFETSLREITPEYWDRMQLDFWCSLYHTNTVPQTTQIPGRQVDLHWTGLMVNRQQVLQAWPSKPTWHRICHRIRRRPRITFR